MRNHVVVKAYQPQIVAGFKNPDGAKRRILKEKSKSIKSRFYYFIAEYPDECENCGKEIKARDFDTTTEGVICPECGYILDVNIDLY